MSGSQLFLRYPNFHRNASRFKWNVAQHNFLYVKNHSISGVSIFQNRLFSISTVNRRSIVNQPRQECSRSCSHVRRIHSSSQSLLLSSTQQTRKRRRRKNSREKNDSNALKTESNNVSTHRYKPIHRRRRAKLGTSRPSRSYTPKLKSSAIVSKHAHQTKVKLHDSKHRNHQDSSSNPIRLHKMERRLTYLLSQYYASLGVVVPQLNVPNEVSENSDNHAKNSNQTQAQSHTYLHTKNNISLPFYSSVSTPNLASVLLHQVAKTPIQSKGTSNTNPSKEDSLVSYQNLLQSEQLYQQVQSTIYQIIVGWINTQGIRYIAQDNPNTIDEKNLTESERFEDGSFNFISAMQILRAQYPIRAEVWLDKMEELRWERYKMVQAHEELNLGVFTKVKSFLSNVFAFFSHSKHTPYPNTDALSAHLKFTPTTDLYIQILREHRKSFYRKRNALSSGGSSSSPTLSFLSSKAITKRQENLLQKSIVSQQRGNPNVDVHHNGMALYEEFLKQYAHVGEKAKEADKLCQKILEFRKHDEKNSSAIQAQQQIKRDARLIHLVMKAYAKDSSSNADNARRIEELLKDLKQLETTHEMPLGSLASPEAYNTCFRAYQNAGWKALPDMTARTQRLFHEISTQIWDENGQMAENESRRNAETKSSEALTQDLIELYNRVIAIYTSSNDINYLHKAKSILQYMEKTYTESDHKFQIPPNTRSFNCILRGFINQKDKNTKIVAQMGSSFLKRMMVLPNAQPSYETYALLLQLWIQSSPSPDIGVQSEMIFSQLEADSIRMQNWDREGSIPKADVKMYTRLIRNWSLSAARKTPNSAQRAYDLLHRMEVESGSNVGIDASFGESPFWNESLKPDSKTYENVIAVCGKTSNFEEYDRALEIALSTYRRMINCGMKPDIIGMIRCLSVLVPAAQSRKRSILAEKVLKLGIEHGNINDAVKGALRKCSPEVYEDYYGDGE